MARWHLTASHINYERAKNVCREAGLETSGRDSTNHYQIQAYRKRAVDVDNFISFSGGEWICAAGTILVDGEVGSSALETLYQRFQTGGVSAVREMAIGHYAIAIKQAQTVSIFTDPQGALALYYTQREDGFVVSNSLHTIAACLLSRTVDQINLMVTALQSSSPSDETFIRGIYRLSGPEVIRVDLECGTLQITELSQSMQEIERGRESITATVESYAHEVRDVFRQIAEQNRACIMTTGGLDTRTVLAAALDRGMSPLLAYGVGNSVLTYPVSADFALAERLADEHDLPVYRMDWSGDHPYSSKTLERLFKRYGFKYEIYGAAESFLAELEGDITPYPDLIVGGYSPAFTNAEPWEWPERTYTYDDLIEHYIHEFVADSEFGCPQAYRAILISAIQEQLRKSPVDIPHSKLGRETFVKAYLYLTFRPGDRMINLINEFCPYLCPFHLKQLYDPLVEVPFDYRAEDEFQLRLIDELRPTLLDTPVVSGGDLMTIDKKSLTRNLWSDYPPSALLSDSSVTRLKGTLLGQMRSRVRPLLEAYLPTEYEMKIRRFYGRLRRDPVIEEDIDDQIKTAATRHVDNNPLTNECLPVPEELRIQDLNRLRHYLQGIETLGYEKIKASS